MLTRLDGLEQEARETVSAAGDLREIQNLRTRYLGKKGELTLLLRALTQIPAAERPLVGKRANALRDTLEKLFHDREAYIKKSTVGERWERESIDVTLPGYPFALGQMHPLTIILDEIKQIFIGLGFQVATGPEIESDYYNFEALNIPEDHPARDMQDSFYFTR